MRKQQNILFGRFSWHKIQTYRTQKLLVIRRRYFCTHFYRRATRFMTSKITTRIPLWNSIIYGLVCQNKQLSFSPRFSKNFLSKMDSNLPIDIQLKKMSHFLQSRKICDKKWHENINEVRKKIAVAITGMLCLKFENWPDERIELHRIITYNLKLPLHKSLSNLLWLYIFSSC